MKKSSKIIAVLLSLCLMTGLGFGLTPLIGTASEGTPAVENSAPEDTATPDASTEAVERGPEQTTDIAADAQKAESVTEAAEEPEE